MWVNNQRNKGTTIREERKKRLESIGFTWKLRATPISVDWEVRFQELVDCKQVHGNCDVSQGYKANKALGIWVTTQRTKEETIREEKKKRLDSIGFTWKVRDHISVPWEFRFQQLVDYKRVHGNCNVSQGYKPNKALGIWVKTQRKNKEAMSDKRRKKLNSIGFAWKFLETWGVRFQQRVEYKRIHAMYHAIAKRICN
mmetsp:Transcript_30432/g.45958  ORF Transcript_30432/g.45958 Transcript_30432/m.45958 type:complete len:198 (-) Transcript_30432:1069-1662(-)